MCVRECREIWMMKAMKWSWCWRVSALRVWDTYRVYAMCGCEERVCYTELRLNIPYIDLIETIGRVYDEKNDSTLEHTHPLSHSPSLSLSLSFPSVMVNVEHCTIYPYQDASDRWYFRRRFVHACCISIPAFSLYIVHQSIKRIPRVCICMVCSILKENKTAERRFAPLCVLAI